MSEANLFIRIAAKTEEFQKGMQSVSDRMKKIGGNISATGTRLTKNLTLPMLAAGGAAIAWATKLGNTADRILDLSEITGLSTGAIQEWQHVAKIAGVDTEAMTRVTERLNREMTNIVSGTGKASKSVAELGIEAEDLANMNADERLDALTQALAGIEDPAERARLGSDLFGRQWEHVAPIVGMGVDEMNKLREAGERYAMSDADLKKANDFRIGMENLKEEFSLAGREIGLRMMPILEQFVDAIGTHVVPVVEKVAGYIGDLIKWFQDLSPEWQSVIKYAALFAVAIGPVLVVVGKVVAVVGALSAAFAFIISPVGLAIAAVVALVGVFTHLWETNENFRDGVIKIWENIKSKATSIFNSIKTFWETWGDSILKLAVSIWDQIKLTIETAINLVSGIIKFVTSIIKGDWSAAWEAVKDIGVTIWRFIRGTAQNIFNGLRDLLANIWDAMRNKAIGVWENIKAGILERATSIRDTVIDTVDTAMQFIRELPAKALQWGKDIIQGLINGVKDMAGNLGGAIKDVAQGAVDSVKGFFGINSPSKLFEGFGINLGQGLEKGMLSTRNMLDNASISMAGFAVPTPQASTAGAVSTSNVYHIHATIDAKELEGIRRVEDFLGLIRLQQRSQGGEA